MRLGSDLRTTLPNDEGSRGFPGGALKLVVLHRDICIGFAGTVPIGLEAIRSAAAVIPADGIDDRSAIELPLVRASVRANVDLLVAWLRPTALLKISQGRVERDLASAWVGDAEAFAAFQEVFVEGKVSLPPTGWEGGVEQYREMRRQSRAQMREQRATFMTPGELDDFDIRERSTDAMREVVEATHIDSVGEAAITVSGTDEDEGFHYLPRVEMHRGGLRSDHPSGVTPIEIGSAEMGDYAVIVSVPDTAGVPAVGIYFVEPRLGYLFLPLRQDIPVVYRNLPASEFHDAVKDDHGITLTGIGITSAG